MIFQYKATTMDGVVIESSIEADDRDTAVARIQRSGYVPISLSTPRGEFRVSLGKFSSRQDVLTFTTELAALLGAGLPLDRGLLVIAELSDSPKMRSVTQSILKSIREGSSFSEALGKHPGVFDRLYVNMVRAGERGGVLDVVLGKLNEFLETQGELRSHVISSLIYPAILIFMSGVSIAILLTFVLPQFSSIFSKYGDSLPLSTRMLMSFSDLLRAYWWAILLALAGCMAALRLYLKTEKGKRSWDRVKLRLLRDIVTELETARFCRTLGTLLKSGVPLLQALLNSRDVINNSVIAMTIDAIARGAKEGKGVAAPLLAAGVFPPLALSMIKVGEETGHLDEMLVKVAVIYEKALRESVKRFISLLEPLLIMIVGLIIGFIIISLLVSIFSITDLSF
jgi:general secretion pathway protein F